MEPTSDHPYIFIIAQGRLAGDNCQSSQHLSIQRYHTVNFLRRFTRFSAALYGNIC
jgi:hypothetical protein